MRKVKFRGKFNKLDYVLYLLSTTILGTPMLCGLMEVLKDFLVRIM